eukprot:COSAG02_NODE_40353_length_406_cov_1.263844_1_plen_21_part_01
MSVLDLTVDCVDVFLSQGVLG